MTLHLYCKTILTAAVFMAACFVSKAQSVLPYDSVTGKTVYQFTIEMDKSYKKDALFQLVQDWYAADATQFNRSNVCDTATVATEKKKNENREAVMKEFQNNSPLQALDPEGNRVTGKVITRYCKPGNDCMRLFYVQYFVVINVQDNRLSCEINDIRYNHFNPRTFTLQRIFNWSNTGNCDPINTIEYLRNCEQCHDEFNGFAAFLNTDISDLMYNLRDFLKENKALTLNAASN